MNRHRSKANIMAPVRVYKDPTAPAISVNEGPTRNSRAKRPYQGFKWNVYAPALCEADKEKIEEAAKLLQLPSKDENGFAFHIQSLAEHYHGEPGVTASAAELKRALDRFSKALRGAIDAWIVLHGSEGNLRLGVLAAIRETYQEVYVEAFINGSGVRPSELFNADESALYRLENMVATTAKRIVPDPSGPAPESRFRLAAEVFAIARAATERKLTFGASARVVRETGSGRRTDDYHACRLLMQAVDPKLTDSQCEGPLEAALSTGQPTTIRKSNQGVGQKTRVRRKK